MRKLPALFFFLLFVFASGPLLSNKPGCLGPPVEEPILNDSALLVNGVAYYDSAKAENGVTMLDEQSKTTFIDMKGRVLAKLPYGLTHILADGSMVCRLGPDLVMFDADLNLVWKRNEVTVHHEITSDENGTIYLLSSEAHRFMDLNINFDVLKVFSPKGDLIYEWHVFDHMKEVISSISKSHYLSGLPEPYDPQSGINAYISQDPMRFFWYNQPVDKYNPHFEFTHFNSIQVLPENAISKKIPAFKKGNLLLSFNPYSCYGILDTATGRIEWAGYLPERTTLHTPLLTPQGTILVFQNSTESSLWPKKENDPCIQYLYDRIDPRSPGPPPEPRNWVSIGEYDPISNALVWEYTASPKESLKAVYLGSAQRLLNGNTLVCAATDDMGGQIFELSRNKQIVWSYVSPKIDPGTHGPTCYYRAKRISYDIAKKIIPGFKP